MAKLAAVLAVLFVATAAFAVVSAGAHSVSADTDFTAPTDDYVIISDQDTLTDFESWAKSTAADGSISVSGKLNGTVGDYAISDFFRTSGDQTAVYIMIDGSLTVSQSVLFGAPAENFTLIVFGGAEGSGLTAATSGAASLIAVGGSNATAVEFHNLTVSNAGCAGSAITVNGNTTFTMTGCTVIGSANATNSAVYCGSGSAVEISGTTITGNAGTGFNGAAVYCGVNAAVTVKNSSVLNNSCANSRTDGGSSGAVYCASGAVVKLDTVKFTGNSATMNYGRGAAVFISSAESVDIANCTFTDNTSTGSGGAIATNNAVLGTGSSRIAVTVTDCTFTGNSAAGNTKWVGSGGAISIGDNYCFEITGCTFTGNSSLQGGAISVWKASDLKVSNCIFKSNTNSAAENPNDGTNQITGGAAIYVNKTTVSRTVAIDGCTFDSNQTGKNGGAIYSNSGNTLTVTDSVFTNNTAADNGGAICTGEKNTLTVTGSTFTSNSATGNGGAVFAGDSGAVVLKNDSFAKNTAVNGGAVYVSYFTSLSMTGDLTDKTAVTGNSVGGDGGAVCLGKATDTTSKAPAVTVIKNVKFVENAAGYGGALFLNINRTAEVSDCVFSGNGFNATNGGAIDAVEGTVLTVTGSSFSKNFAGYGGAIFATSKITAHSVISISSSVFSENSVRLNGGAIDVVKYCELTLTDVTFSGNVAHGGTANDTTGLGAAVYASQSYVSGNGVQVAAGGAPNGDLYFNKAYSVHLDLSLPGAATGDLTIGCNDSGSSAVLWTLRNEDPAVYNTAGGAVITVAKSGLSASSAVGVSRAADTYAMSLKYADKTVYANIPDGEAVSAVAEAGVTLIGYATVTVTTVTVIGSQSTSATAAVVPGSMYKFTLGTSPAGYTLTGVKLGETELSIPQTEYAVGPIDSDVTITVTYTEDVKKYNLSFTGDDGVTGFAYALNGGSWTNVTGQLVLDGIREGTQVQVRPVFADTYIFGSWSDGSAAADLKFEVDAAVSLTLTSVKTYTITWNVDGTETVQTVSAGTLPSYGGTPVRAPTAQNYFVFSGWNAAVVPAAADATYTALFETHVQQYTVKFVSDGTVLQEQVYDYGTVPAYTGAVPVRTADDQYSYTFAGWSSPVTEVTGETVYTALFETHVQQYTVKFVSDGVVLQETVLDYGTVPAYTGAVPARASTAQNYFVFGGWDAELAPVTGEAVYTALFETHVQQYTVKFVSDGTVLQATVLDYGTVPTYTGAVPVRASTAQNYFVFSSWDAELAPVTGDVTYTAVFEAYLQHYTVKFVSDGVVLQEQVYDYGTVPAYTGAVPVRTADAQYSYTFANWSPSVAQVTGDITYEAVFSSEVRTYTVTLVQTEGCTITALGALQVPYGGSFSFQVDVNGRYSQSVYTVLANTAVLAGTDGFYTIGNIAADQTVTVVGISLNVYSIEGTIDRGTVTQSQQIADGGNSADMVFTAADGYRIVAVVINGEMTAITGNNIPAITFQKISGVTENIKIQVFTNELVADDADDINAAVPRSSEMVTVISVGGTTTVIRRVIGDDEERQKAAELLRERQAAERAAPADGDDDRQ